jgi:hypothetical protein
LLIDHFIPRKVGAIMAGMEGREEYTGHEDIEEHLLESQ